MARRKRFSILAASTAAIIGVALYLPGSASFINGFPVGSGYGGANCPVGIDFAVTPSPVTYGGVVTINGRLVPEAGADVSGKSIHLNTIRAGTGTPQGLSIVTTNANGYFTFSWRPFWSAFNYARYNGTSVCPAERSGDSNQVRVRISIARSAATVAAGSPFTISGGVRFGHPGGHMSIQWFKPGGSVVTAPMTLNSLSNYSKTFTSRSRGVFFFRTIFPTQDVDHLGSHTVWIQVTIV